MKKFLSSLLALTMILSLVIVPANAEGLDNPAPNNVTGVIAANALSISGAPSSAMAISDTATLVPSISDEALTYDGAEVKMPTKTYSWSSSNDSIVSVGNDGKITANKDGKATITCQVTMTGTVTLNESSTDRDITYTVTGTQSKSIKITVAAPEVIYIITGKPTVKATVDGKDVSNVKHNTTVDFSIDGDITVKSKTGDAEEVTLTKGTDYTLEYAWSGVSGSSASVSQKLTNTTSSPKTVTAGCTITVKVGG